MSILADPLTLPPEERRRPARSLYWRGWSLGQIAGELDLKYDTVKSWARRDRWDDAPSIRKLEDCLETRLMVLICKEQKTGADYTELDALRRQVE
ncbi:terminase, partial [Acinetobacter baumannii]|uniref:terminase gpP N-terminus-related DNA-binding protein n=3 Tax=Pseudomonadota TaxID=1224 RepID=UPI003F50AFDC|nr:terminase [Acinetobacter baumannii]